MQGAIFLEFKKFVEANFGREAWNALLEESGLANRSYLPSEIYPESDVLALASTVSSFTRIPIPNLLQDFGAFMAPELQTMYWDCLSNASALHRFNHERERLFA